MTLRALFIGLIAALFIAGAGYVNDRILELESFNSGHLLPVIVLGALFLAVLLINPVIYNVRRSWAFRPAEMALIVVLASAACSIPGRGLMEQFAQNIIMPFHWYQVTPGWREHDLMKYVPENAYVERTDENHDDVVTRFVTGSYGEGRQDEPWGRKLARTWDQVPWHAWLRPLKTWFPMILLNALIMCCLAVMVHRQWSQHEHLSYPIADFTTTLLDREEGRMFPDVFRTKAFWWGLGLIFAIRLNNGLHRWFPEAMIPVNLTWRLTPLGTLWPSIYKVQWGSQLLNLNFFPLVAAFAFFLSTEISLTLGVSQYMYFFFALPLVTHGVNMSTLYTIGGWNGYMRAGSYTAFALMMIYTGRQYYRELLARAVLFWKRVESSVDTAAVYACRICIVAFVALVVLVMKMGLEWPYAVATVLLMHLTFVIVARISAETGLFFIQSRWQPVGVLLGMLGGYAMGPAGIVICTLICINLSIDQSQAIMPYLTNGLKIGEKVNLKPGRLAGVTYGVYIAGVVLAIAVVLVALYDFGDPNYNWSHIRVPSMPFHAVEPEVLHLKATGSLEQAETLPWFRRLMSIHPRENFWWAASLGFIFVILFSLLRLRVPKWPLHPVVFLLWSTYPMSFTCFSFLVGWMVKRVAMRFGGTRTVRRIRPFMIGVIAGEILGALVFMLAGAIYYFVTGEKPISYRYFPR